MPPRKPAATSAPKTTKRAPVKPGAKRTTKTRKDTGKGHASSARAKAKATAKAPENRPGPVKPGKGGPRMNAGQQALRDSMMIQRLAQDWPWEAIAEEAGLTERSARAAVKKRQATAPLPLNMDPVRTIERIARGINLSIGDFEAVSARAMLEGDFAAATSAKKAANDAREKLVGLLQATGRMPQDLSTLRHLMDVREVGTAMVVAMEGFRDEIAAAALLRPVQRKVAIDDATDRVIRHFEEAMGFDREAELGEGEDWDDTEDGAEEVTATPA